MRIAKQPMGAIAIRPIGLVRVLIMRGGTDDNFGGAYSLLPIWRGAMMRPRRLLALQQHALRNQSLSSSRRKKVTTIKPSPAPAPAQPAR